MSKQVMERYVPAQQELSSILPWSEKLTAPILFCILGNFSCTADGQQELAMFSDSSPICK